MTDEEKRSTAYHEAGHALVARLRRRADPLHKVTIIPRGRALGVTMQLPAEDKYTYTKEFVEARIAVMMGGRAPKRCLERHHHRRRATTSSARPTMARQMVCEWGMSDLGPLAFGGDSEPVFLGRDFAQKAAYSEETAQRIDAEVSRIVQRAYEQARDILKRQRAVLDRIAANLLEKESLEGAEVYATIAELTGEHLDPTPRPLPDAAAPAAGSAIANPASGRPASGPAFTPEATPA